MNGQYRILGQTVQIGAVNIDPYMVRENLPSTCVTYITPPTYFDGIEAVRQHNDGVFPDSDYTAYWYGAGEDPVFAIYVTYNAGGKFNLSYQFRQYNSMTQEFYWTDNYPHAHYYNDGYAGADPSNITAEDRWRQGIYFGYITDGLYDMPVEENQKYGIIEQHYEIHEIPGGGFASAGYIENPESASFELKTNYPGDRYDWTGGGAYTKDTDGRYNAEFLNQVGPGVMLFLSAHAHKDDDYTEDISGPGGGGGYYNSVSLKIPIPGKPSLNIMDTGAATMWAPSPAEIKAFNAYLWTDDFIDNIKKINADPLANVIQFGLFPLDLSSLKGTLKEVKVGNVATGVNMTPLTDQFILVDLGTVSPREKWGSCLDYEPNTRVSIYVPFVGAVDVAASEVMNKSVNLFYWVDLLSGDFVAYIRVIGNGIDSILYQKTGNMQLQFPLSAANYANLYKTVTAGIAGVAAGAATGNAGAIASSLGEMAGAVMSGGSQIELSRTGNFSGAASILSGFDAYIILTRPIQQMPDSYSKYVGYPSYITYKLGNLSGFTKVEEVIDNTVAATDREKEEIERLLKEGVYL